MSTHLNPNTPVTALSLLDAFGRLFSSSARPAWPSEDAMRDYPPTACRVGQVKALFAAYGIPPDPAGFQRGDFIGVDSERHAGLVERLRQHLEPPHNERLCTRDLRYLFTVLRDYREGMARGRRSYGDFLCWPAIVGYAVEDVIGAINQEVTRAMAPVDSLLTELISPENKTFIVGQLITEFGYPDEDADELDWQATWGVLFDEGEEK